MTPLLALSNALRSWSASVLAASSICSIDLALLACAIATAALSRFCRSSPALLDVVSCANSDNSDTRVRSFSTSDFNESRSNKIFGSTEGAYTQTQNKGLVRVYEA